MSNATTPQIKTPTERAAELHRLTTEQIEQHALALAQRCVNETSITETSPSSWRLSADVFLQLRLAPHNLCEGDSQAVAGRAADLLHAAGWAACSSPAKIMLTAVVPRTSVKDDRSTP